MRTLLTLFWSNLLLVGAVRADAPLRAELPVESWRFQPGKSIDVSPAEGDWAAVKPSCLWAPSWQSHGIPRAGKSWEKLNLGEVNSAWFEASVPVPAEWQGKRVYLDLSGVECAAVVLVNGQRLAEAIGPDDRVDLTRAVTCGTEAQVRLWVTRWWEGTENKRQADVFRDMTIRALAVSPWYKGDDEVRKAIPAGLSGAVKLQAVPREAEIRNVLVESSFRRKELRVHVEYVCSEPAAGARLKVQVAERDGRTDGLPQGSAPLESVGPSPETRRQVLIVPWQNPRLWEVGAAYLYLLHVSLEDGQGRSVDRYPPVRFGFREVWTEGRWLMLNGHPLRLRLAPFVNSPVQMTFFEGLGFNALEGQPNPNSWYSTWGMFPSGEGQAASAEILDAADERGWAVLMPVPGVSYVRDRLLEPPVEARFLRDSRAWMRRWDRLNRPSILMWSPSMNTAGNLDPARLGRAPSAPPPAWYAKSEALIKSLDPTRLVFHHQGGQTGEVETTNLYPNFMPLQEGEEFLSAWSESAEKPWGAVEYGHPIFEDFLKIRNTAYFTEYGAIYFGDRAYAAEKAEYVQAVLDALKAGGTTAGGAFQLADLFMKAGGKRVGEWTTYYDLMGLFIRSVHRSWRAYGMNGGLLPWISLTTGFGDPPKDAFARDEEKLKQRPDWANPIYDFYREIGQPLLVYVGGPRDRFTAKDHSFYAGEEVEKTIVAVWDGPGRKALKVEWSFAAGERLVQHGTETFDLSPGAIEKRPLRLKMPPGTARTTGEVRIAVSDAASARVSEDSFALTVFPTARKLPALTSRWALFDPVGKTTAELAKLGLRLRGVRPGDSLKGVDVLLIGREALRGKARLPFAVEDVRRGLRVLFCEQDVESLEALGFRVQDVVPRYVFPRVRSHPALAGVQPEDLINWRGAGTLVPATSEGRRAWPYPHAPHWGNTGSVASVVIETPHQGAFTPLLECEFDLAYSPLLEWRDGAGTVLFCQLDLTGRIGLEPAADLLTRNLLRYLDGYARQRRGPAGRSLFFLGEEKGSAFVRGLGLQFAMHRSGPLRLSPAGHVAVVGPDALAAATTNLQELRAFVRAGGTVVVLPQSAEHWSAPSLPWRVEVSPRKIHRVLPEDDAPDLTGIGPQLLHFRTFLDAPCFNSAPPGSRRLLDGLLLQVNEGKGRWLLCQVDWRLLADDSDNLKRARWNVTKFYRQLLTNCGARTDEALARQFLSPTRYAPLVDVGLWQAAVNPTTIPVETAKVQDVEGAHIREGTRIALPALGRTLEGEAWLQDPRAPTWRLRGADRNGWVDFTAITPHQIGKVAYAVTHLYSSTPRQASFALDSDWWFVLTINGRQYVDQSREGRVPGPPRKGAIRLQAPLKAGWNRVEMKVASGGAGFGFWCQVSDPGDLRVSPTLAEPSYAPRESPSKADLLPEPLVQSATVFYAEALEDRDDPYGFCPW
jgi:beta-galactosidase